MSEAKLKSLKAASSGFTAHFLLERETKGALRYQQVTSSEASTPYGIGEGAELGTLYVRKSALNGAPKRLVIAVTEG